MMCIRGRHLFLQIGPGVTCNIWTVPCCISRCWYLQGFFSQAAFSEALFVYVHAICPVFLIVGSNTCPRQASLGIGERGGWYKHTAYIKLLNILDMHLKTRFLIYESVGYELQGLALQKTSHFFHENSAPAASFIQVMWSWTQCHLPTALLLWHRMHRGCWLLCRGLHSQHRQHKQSERRGHPKE